MPLLKPLFDCCAAHTPLVHDDVPVSLGLAGPGPLVDRECLAWSTQGQTRLDDSKLADPSAIDCAINPSSSS